MHERHVEVLTLFIINRLVCARLNALLSQDESEWIARECRGCIPIEVARELIENNDLREPPLRRLPPPPQLSDRCRSVYGTETSLDQWIELLSLRPSVRVRHSEPKVQHFTAFETVTRHICPVKTPILARSSNHLKTK